MCATYCYLESWNCNDGLGTHLQRGNVVHGWPSARSPRVTAGMSSGGRSPTSSSCPTPADPCRPIAESAIQPSNEGCNRGRIVSLAPGAIRSSRWSLTRWCDTIRMEHQPPDLHLVVGQSLCTSRSPPANAAHESESPITPDINTVTAPDDDTLACHTSKTPTALAGRRPHSRVITLASSEIDHTQFPFRRLIDESLSSLASEKYVTRDSSRAIRPSLPRWRNAIRVADSRAAADPSFPNWRREGRNFEDTQREKAKSPEAIKILAIRHESMHACMYICIQINIYARVYMYMCPVCVYVRACVRACGRTRARLSIFRARRTHTRGGTADTHQP